MAASPQQNLLECAIGLRAELDNLSHLWEVQHFEYGDVVFHAKKRALRPRSWWVSVPLVRQALVRNVQ